MSLIGDIEIALINALKSIDGTTDSVPGHNPYSFNTITGQVNLRDEVVSLVADNISNSVSYNINILDEDNLEIEYGANCLGNKIGFNIIANPKCNSIGITKNIINEQINLLLEDIKFVLFKHNTLNNTCFSVTLNRSSRKFTSTNDMINGGSLELDLTVVYGQFGSSPNVPYNNNFI